jgi:hypothetical protein
MQSEHAGGQEEKFLAFSAGGISYVLPLSDVGQIVAEVPQNMPEISVSGTKGGCAVIFQDDAGFAALSVEKVSGIVELKPSCQHVFRNWSGCNHYGSCAQRCQRIHC